MLRVRGVGGGERSEGGLDVSLVGFERRDRVDNTVKLGLEVVMVNINGGGTESLSEIERCGVLSMRAMIAFDKLVSTNGSLHLYR
ncbi:unnamed protein product [Prunus armeniaca]|uniref:Uncharacterized protein n=1 Tax=Prunus armeniaca TaxID=36596 RepID=A0A6J5WS33_PRUAR|nr:unnamed protein product [Prunus armeniaca]